MRVAVGALLVRADADARIGTGHVMRCLAIAQAWRDAGGVVTWGTTSLPEALGARLSAEGITLERVDGSAEAFARLSQRVGPSFALVDGYGFGAAMHRAGAGSGARVVVVDDDAANTEYAADVIVDPNVFADVSLYARWSAKKLIGPSYALLRRELTDGGSPTVDRAGRHVLGSFGGADPAGLSEVFVAAAAGLALDAVLLVGPANPRLEAIRVAAAAAPSVRVVYNEADMRARYAWADIAVVAAGGTCLELAFMGVPALVAVTAENQRRVAEGFVARGAARSLGDSSGVDARSMRDALRMLLDDPTARAAMSAAGRALVDGRGASRVVQAMLEES